MRKERNYLFREDAYSLQEMIQLRLDGWTLRKLAEKYNVDPKTISNECNKAGLVLGNVEPIKKTSKKVEESWYLNEFGERVNKGNDYRTYLQNANVKVKRML